MLLIARCVVGTCRLMAAGGAGASLLPAACRRRCVVRQLAPRRLSCRRRPEVHPVQGPRSCIYGLRLRYVHAELFPYSFLYHVGLML
jgi:hypothetical protein